MLETKILTKLEQLTYYYEKFSVFLPPSLEHYQKSLKDQMAIERLFQVSIECMMDISFSLVKLLNLGVPSDEDNVFDLLDSKFENGEKYKEMKGFRNVLVHQYAKINNDLVYKYATEKISDIQDFIAEVKKILQNFE